MMIPMAWVLLFIGLLFLAVRLLHLASPACAPTIIHSGSKLAEQIIKACPLLTEPYIPPLLWGKSGQIQTLIYGKWGRFYTPLPQGRRNAAIMEDGATMTYDVFEPEKAHPSDGDYTILLCPGIASNSECLYVKTCVHHAQTNGFRVAVLNHLGALPNVPLTAPRVFSYGETGEFAKMVNCILDTYPDTRCIALGLSMGGNVVLKYLGEEQEHQEKIMAAVSICNGYSIENMDPFFHTWEHLRRFYFFILTEYVKNILREHADMLFGPEAQAKYGEFDQDAIFASDNLKDLDDRYTRQRLGFKNVHDFYHWSSCRTYLENIDIPVMCLNSLDDPMVPVELLHTGKEFAMSKENVIFCTTEHGGHLGYFEGSVLKPNSLTWLDKVVVEYSNAFIAVAGKNNNKMAAKRRDQLSEASAY